MNLLQAVRAARDGPTNRALRRLLSRVEKCLVEYEALETSAESFLDNFPAASGPPLDPAALAPGTPPLLVAHTKIRHALHRVRQTTQPTP